MGVTDTKGKRRKEDQVSTTSIFFGHDDRNSEYSFEEVVDPHCVRDETAAMSLNHFLYTYIIRELFRESG